MKFLDLIFFARPMLLFPVWTVYLHFLATTSDTPRGWNMPPRESLYHLIGLSLIFGGIYVFNQIFDIESDRLNDKLHFLPRGILSLKTAWGYYAFLTIAGTALMAWVNVSTLRPAMTIIILGILYSAPGLRLKDNAIGGLLANAVAYGIMVPYIIFAGKVHTGTWPAVLPYFFAISAGYILTTIPDYDGDAATGKKTVAVILGPRGTLWLALLTSTATALVSVWLGNIEVMTVAAVTMMLVIILLVSYQYALLLFTCTFPILLLTICAALHYPVYAAFCLLTTVLTKLYYKKRFNITYPKLS